MKKLFAVLLLLCSASLFAEQFVIKTWMHYDRLETNSAICPNVDILEICPVNDSLCKVVLSNGVVEYVRKGDIWVCEYLVSVEGKRYEPKKVVTKNKVTDFDYNRIYTEVIEKN